MSDRQPIAFEDELNQQQLQVVTSGRGPMLVLAGAGSGKTRTLTYRVAYLIEQGVDPHSILLLTFTNKAAREMLFRVESIVPFDVKKIWGGTFHHIGNRILRSHIHRIGYDPDFTILDQTDSIDLINSCLDELGHKRKDGMLPQGSVLVSIISLARNTRVTTEEVLEQRYPYFFDYCEQIEEVEQHYRDKKRRLNLLDFDDLLCLWLQILEEHPTVCDFYAGRFEFVLVDEYQDTNKLQADIIDLMASRHRNVMVVGDDSQSIYAFRGANFANIMQFPERYPDADIYKLEYNYRSSPHILTLANESITYNQNQFRKELQPVKEGGTQPYMVMPSTMQQQAAFVADRIQELVYNGLEADNIAVLYRAHYHSMELQMELSRRNIAFEIRSGIRFFEQAHIKDIVSYIKIVANPSDEIAWKRILQLLPGIGKKTAQKIFDHLAAAPDPLRACLDESTAKKVPKGAKPHWSSVQDIISALISTGTDVSPAALIKAILENGYRTFMRSKYTDARSRGEDIDQFMEFAWQYNSLHDFLSELALMTGNEADGVQDTDARERIKLSTIHQAKGLEWSVVFIISLVEGRFPNPHNFDSLEDEEEERRLFYVAVTRAKDILFLCSPIYAKDNTGYTSVMKPSRFLREIGDGHVEKIEMHSGYGSSY